jgi:hypothetical protein
MAFGFISANSRPGLNWETLVEDAREERMKEVLGL